ncbi:hypothetical protein SAMN05192585_101118 [Acetanaerobacterium elongatum]|uniref:Uncharacterized protein n=2 Tax=Acetanaerobacterium elongatum TaxID=258515 RepID=A0A1G9U8U8_9FIRM|nr:hypothetical protein SAMN05192585_101118 [Acetanaerobacterium elongatum]
MNAPVEFPHSFSAALSHNKTWIGDKLMEYTRRQIREKCSCDFKSVKTFYQADVVNYLGNSSDTGESYNEIVAEFVLENLDTFLHSIPQITREASYRNSSHDGEYSASSNRVEEITAIRLFNHCKDGTEYDFIGRIIDYQTPLKSKRSDTAGKIDLLAYDGDTLRLLELKKPDSMETMLRCVLEAYTYLKTVDTAKLLCDYELPASSSILACPLVFKGGNQWAEMQKDRTQLKKLMAALGSKPYYITERGNSLYIEEK